MSDQQRCPRCGSTDTWAEKVPVPMVGDPYRTMEGTRHCRRCEETGQLRAAAQWLLEQVETNGPDVEAAAAQLRKLVPADEGRCRPDPPQMAPEANPLPYRQERNDRIREALEPCGRRLNNRKLMAAAGVFYIGDVPTCSRPPGHDGLHQDGWNGSWSDAWSQ